MASRTTSQGAQTTLNLSREKECVLNLPSVDSVGAVNRLARLTGAPLVTLWKQSGGYRYEKDKLGVAGLTTSPSFYERTPRINECPIQLEAVLESKRPFGIAPEKNPDAYALEVRVVRALA